MKSTTTVSEVSGLLRENTLASHRIVPLSLLMDMRIP